MSASRELPQLARPRGREWSLRQQLFALFFVFSLGPLVVTNTWGYLQSRHYGTEGELHAAHNIASLEAAGVLHSVGEHHHWIASIVADNNSLFSLLRALNRPEGEARTAVALALRQHLAEKAHEDAVVRELSIIAPDGRLLGSSLGLPSIPADLSESACFRRGRQVAAIDGVDFQGREPVLLVSAPIRDEAGDFLGVLCGQVRFQMHLDVARLETGRSMQTAVFLLDYSGRVIDEAHGEGPSPPPLLGRLLVRDAPKTFGAEPWQGRYRTTSEEVLGAFAPIPELGWGVLVEKPLAAAMADFDLLKWQAVAFGGLLAFLVVAAILVVARRISQPMLALSEAASRATQGEFDVTIPPGGTVEVSNLARAFNTLGLAVKESHSLLEERIAARTRELQRSQEFSEKLLDSIDEPVVVVDRALTFVAANAAARRRYGADLVGRRYHEDLALQAEASIASCPVCVTLETGRPAADERTERIGQAEDVVSRQAFPVLAEDGKVDAVIELRRVITDERRLQAQMVHHEKMAAFGLLAAGVAHEVGNPLAAIQSQIRMAEEAPKPGRTEETLTVVSREVERISRLLRELVSFARNQDEEVALVAMDKVIDDVVRLVCYDPRARKVAVEVEHDPAAVVRAKEDHLVQVLLNLALNSLDAMPGGGTLRFEIASADSAVVVRVRDTGGGIPAGVRGHIFEPFFTTKARGQGTGLGLFVTQGLVRGMQGFLEVENSDKAGTAFRLQFPAATWRSRAAHV
jgi:C4-dicarboxylate-specific signal transduction histidine kinase